MRVHILDDRKLLGAKAGYFAAINLRAALEAQRTVNAIFAAAPSQDETLDNLFAEPDIAWQRVNFFHMDEYVGIRRRHKASFRNYFDRRIPRLIRKRLKSCTWIEGNAKSPKRELIRLNRRLTGLRIDLCCLGIGENGHLAFNDPPCRMGDDVPPVILVDLDLRCREQQVNEGHFPDLDSVPKTAFSMSVPFLLTAKSLVCSVPGPWKADAVKALFDCVTPNPNNPASYLRRHPDCDLCLDQESAAKAERS